MMDELLSAAARLNMPVVVIGGTTSGTTAPVPPPSPWEEPVDPAEQVAQENEELTQLRAQVQHLTTQLAEADQALAAARAATEEGGAPVPPAAPQGADSPPQVDHGIEHLGFADEKLERKLMRLGFDTIGKLADAFARGEDGPLWNDGKPVLKKDWMIEVGMKVIAGQGPSRGAGAIPAATAGVSAGGAIDVPEGHTDRPWLERLAAARTKQADLDSARERMADKQQEIDDIEQAEEEVSEDLWEAFYAAEADVERVRAQLIATRWCLGLDPDPALSLDEALERANLGPWMSDPQPRLMSEASG